MYPNDFKSSKMHLDDFKYTHNVLTYHLICSLFKHWYSVIRRDYFMIAQKGGGMVSSFPGILSAQLQVWNLSMTLLKAWWTVQQKRKALLFMLLCQPCVYHKKKRQEDKFFIPYIFHFHRATYCLENSHDLNSKPL